MQFTKYVLPVIVGAMLGIILIALGEIGLQMTYPMHGGPDMYGADPVVFLPELLIHIISSFFAGLVSSLLSKRESTRPPIVVGIVLTFASLYKIINLPHLSWFSVADLFVYLPFAYLGYLVVRKKTVSPA